VHCTDNRGRRGRIRRAIAIGSLAIALAACSGLSADRAPGEAGDVGRTTAVPPSPRIAATAPADGRRALPSPRTSRNWNELRQQAAERIVAANPEITYTGVVPDPLLAIPVLEIELNGDGTIRRIEVLREPRQAKDTLKIAVDAVRRAAPFGDVSRLPRPWKFAETFLFDDSRKFKPRTLDH
jgi:hypothetical protein